MDRGPFGCIREIISPIKAYNEELGEMKTKFMWEARWCFSPIHKKWFKIVEYHPSVGRGKIIVTNDYIYSVELKV